METRVDSKGAFSFPQVVEGKYVLQSFGDLNGNGEYDTGKPIPFVPSEPLGKQSDTLKVRARWPLEGVRLRLP
ncbi:MAG: hypothetical protein HY966_08250 [Ignavibacteriales bacterium]|nr:hypothetical protein [Ignavibacteriales bacterium]